MKKTILTLLASVALAALTANAGGDLTGKVIYINPGHGGYGATSSDADGVRTDGTTATDRWIATINYPNVCEEGFWESTGNLRKGLALRDMLQARGATVHMSRTQNRGIDDRVLTEIGEEATSYNADMFLSIHTNGNNASDNYVLTLFRGSDSGAKTDPDLPASRDMARAGWLALHRNPVTYWTARKDESNPYVIADSAFYGTYHLGVLRRLWVPGYLAECTFHDYRPETHRLLSEDYNKFQAWQLYTSICDYFQTDAATTGVIIGAVKDDQRKPGDKNFPRNANGDDQWLPINGATVTLKDATGATVSTYTTDQFNNGLYYFDNLTPGDYSLQLSATGYNDSIQAITVTAGAAAGGTIKLHDPSYDPAAEAGVPNALAYDLQSTAADKVSFKLNSDASVTFNIVDAQGNITHSTPLGTFSKGQNEATVSVEDLTNGQYDWALTVTGPSTADQLDPVISALDNDSLMVKSGKGVYVENDPDSPAFGYVFATVPGGYKIGGSCGIMKLNPLMQRQGIYDLGVSWTGASGPMNISESGVSGKAILSDWTDGANSGAWLADITDLTQPAQRVFAGTHNTSGLITNNGATVAGSLYSACGITRDGTTYLYTCDEDTPGDAGAVNIFRYDDYINNIPWGVAPSKCVGNWSTKLVNTNACVAPDRRGGMWICQYRASNGTTYPSVMHMNANDDKDLEVTDASVVPSTVKAALGVSVDGSHIAVCSSAGVEVLSVTWGANGVPAVAKEATLTSPLIASAYQIAFDAADNIYLMASNTSAANSGLAQWAMPKAQNTCTTRAPKTSKFAFSGIEAVGNDASATVTGRYNIAGQAVDADAQGVQIVRYSDGSARKVIVR